MKYIALALLLVGVHTQGAKASSDVSVVHKCMYSVHHVYKERTATRTLEYKMGHNPSRSVFFAASIRSCKYVRWVGHYWYNEHQERADEYRKWLSQQRKQQQEGASWLVSAFLCIHSHEGAWDSNTGNDYYGGLQFGYKEWQTYGGSYASMAYDATPSEQIQAGINYWRVSGFSPWPRTARMCNLL